MFIVTEWGAGGNARRSSAMRRAAHDRQLAPPRIAPQLENRGSAKIPSTKNPLLSEFAQESHGTRNRPSLAATKRLRNSLATRKWKRSTIDKILKLRQAQPRAVGANVKPWATCQSPSGKATRSLPRTPLCLAARVVPGARGGHEPDLISPGTL